MEVNEEFNIGNNFVINNDQGLEEEELIDHQRRYKEIHNAVAREMGNCSLTDDSSINSSSHTAVGTCSDPPVFTTENFEKQYLESNVDEQLKVLYEIRCSEVKELNEQLHKIKAELQEHQLVSKTKIALIELENERKSISLHEAQNLLADKTEQINELNKQVENMKCMVTCLEGNLAEVSDEKEIMRQLNLSLEQQIHLMEKNGFPLMNKSADRELRESLNSKIKQLEHSLANALAQNELRAKQHSELVRELKRNLQEKDDCLAEKGFLINKLTENFEAAQVQCHELMKTINELREGQARTAREAKESVVQTSALDEELRKVRDNKERSELCESVRRAVIDEFQIKINSLSTENKILSEKLYVQEKQLNGALKREEIIGIIENEKAVLQKKLHNLEQTLQFALEENRKLSAQHPQLDVSLQTSFASVAIADFDNLKKDNKKILQEIESAQEYIHQLETKYSQLQEEHSRLMVKVELEQERDALINELKEKAINFERVILEKQQIYLKQQNEKVSIGINTEQYDEANNSLLKLKHDALLFQREADLRCTLKKEFDAKHESVFTKYKVQLTHHTSCDDCDQLKAELKDIREERKQDRLAVLQLVDAWQNRFEEVGNSFDDKLNNCISSIDKEYSERFKLLAHMLQKQFLKEVKQQEVKVGQTSVRVNSIINDGINKIIARIQEGNIEVQKINEQLKTKPDRKHKIKKH